MINLTRRSVFLGSSALAASAFIAPLLERPRAFAQELPFQPERGARLRLMRPTPFLDAEVVHFNANVQTFAKITGVPVQVDMEFLDDLQPKAAVAANVGAGPDLLWGPMSIPQLIPDKLLDVSDLAEHLGKKYGGWYDMPTAASTRDGRWVALPLIVLANYVNYRRSWVQNAGFDVFPENMDDFLKLSAELKKMGHPGGMALGHATNDANAWVHWLLWSFGGKLVDENNQVAISSPETRAALEYMRELYQTWIPGTASWNDASNNKAFLSGQVGYTNNSISIYAKAVADQMPMAEDIEHAYYPTGPVGRPTELHLAMPIEAFAYTNYPNAAKALMAFLMEEPQYDSWLDACVGYHRQTLQGFEDLPVWTKDPKRTVFRDGSARSLHFGYAGNLGYAAAAALADFIAVDMVAAAAIGQQSPQEAMDQAEKRAQRYYKV
jgi:multiple sugar transport system substrate-binding protein